MKKNILFFFFFYFTLKIQAQQPDSLAITTLPDTLILTNSTGAKKGVFTFFSKDYPNPRKAALLGLIVPGAGQIYNKRWWKLPLVYGAMGGTLYAINYNKDFYRRFKTAYIQKINNQETEFKGLAIDNPRSLRVFRDQYDKNTQLSYVGLVAVYALQSVEAFVDAHLKTFNVNEDLSLQLKPDIQLNTPTGQPSLGVGMVLKFE